MRAQMEENDRELKSLGSRAEALDRQLDVMCEVFADAGQLIHVAKQAAAAEPDECRAAGAGSARDDEGHTLDLEIARVPGDPPRERAFALVRVVRADVPKARNMLDEAARLL